jgi:hypothetical protein
MKKAVFKKMKRTISFILIIAIVASSGILSSCSIEREDPAALTLNGKEIKNDVFTYFIDKAMTELGVNADENAVLTRATELTTTYYKPSSKYVLSQLS